MKILNISFIIPLEGLKRENDIILRVQDYLNKQFGCEFTLVKFLPYAPKLLGLFSKKWKKYNEYLKLSKTEIEGYTTFIHPWLMLPTSNLWINYFLIPLNIIHYHLFLKYKLLKEAHNADLIIAQNNVPDAIVAYLLAKQTKKPYILNLRRDFSPIILSMPFLSKIYRNAHQIITPNPEKYKKTKKKIKIELVPHPVETRFFNKEDKLFKLPVKLVSVCRLLEYKHIDWVVNSLAHLKEMNYQFEYNIIGDGPELENLKQLSFKKNLNDNVVFHGYREYSEIDNYLKSYHVFIMPSYPETLGRAFIEAAASDCLVIGHKNTGVDGLFKHKESAIFVDRSKITNELEAIFKNFNKEYFYYYVGNAKKIVKNLTWENIGKKYYKLYSKAIEKN